MSNCCYSTAFTLFFFTVLSSMHRTRDLKFVVSKRVRLAVRAVMCIALALVAVFADLTVLAMMGSVTAIVFGLVIWGYVGSSVVGSLDSEPAAVQSTGTFF
jgi:hypothetical protein